MGLTDRWWRLLGTRPAARDLPLSWDAYQAYFRFMGNRYGVTLRTTIRGNTEEIGRGYGGMAGVFGGNPVVFACMALRMRVFAEARFMYRRLRSGRPGDLFSNPELDHLRRPWPNGTTADLLTKMILHADLAGNAFVRRSGNRLQVLRPDWVTIVSGVPRGDEGSTGWDLGAEVLGYGYTPGGPGSGNDPVPLTVREVAHFAPYPDPLAPWRGMSWLSPVIRDVMGDNAATQHKLAFFENGATPNLVVKADPSLNLESFREFVREFKAGKEGLEHAYETLFLGGGADATVVGADMKQLDFKITQGAGETRIAAAAGTPPVLVGLSEGLQAATYSNYGQARRAFADETMRPTWRTAAGALSSITTVPSDAELWYDDADVPFLAEDMKDAAEIQKVHTSAIREMVDGGFEPDSVVDAIVAGDLKRLKHTGKLSVQLQEPGETPAAPEGNGQGTVNELVPATEGGEQ